MCSGGERLGMGVDVDTGMKEQHMIPFELPAYFFHALMNELIFGTSIYRDRGNALHDPEVCNRLYKMLAAQVGQEIVEGKDEPSRSIRRT